jgi:hypothetical protein
MRLDLRCWFTNCRWYQLQGQRSAGALAGNQLLLNAALKRNEKALIDLVDGLSSGSVVLVSVARLFSFVLLLLSTFFGIGKVQKNLGDTLRKRKKYD